MKKILFAFVLVLLLTGVSGAVYAKTYTLHTTTSFVEMLIERGIVPAPLASSARSLAALIDRVEAVQQEAPQSEIRNADKVTLSVSQLIEYASREYDAGSDIKGLLLVVKNPTNDTLTLDAKRKCQTIYRVYDTDDALVYDSATTEACQTDEKVTWELTPGQSRMFQTVHPQSAYQLAPGVYRFELEYPGYGKGELSVTVR